MKSNRLLTFLALLFISFGCSLLPDLLTTRETEREATPTITPNLADQQTLTFQQTEVALQQTQVAVQQTQTALAATPVPVSTPTQPRRTATLAPPTPIYYPLINRHTQMCLTAPLGNSLVVQSECNAARDEQLWKVPTDAVYFNLQVKNGPCASFREGHAELIQSACDSSPMWTLRLFGNYYGIPFPITLPHSHPTVIPKETGTYYQIQYGNQCVDVEGWDHADGGIIIHDDCRGSDMDNQLWARYLP